MSKIMKVVVNGNPYEIEIENINESPMSVAVNGQTYQVTLEAEKGQITSPIISNSVPVPSIKPVIMAPKPQQVAAASSSNEMRSPMPGLILDIVVKPGSKVSRGQNMMALEAMKMKNAIRAPKDGIIQSIAVSEGQKVAYNDLLVIFE